MVRYEWVCEVMDGEDITDSRAWDTLEEARRDAQGEQAVIVLVRDLWRDGDLISRSWAYPVDGKLPTVLTDAENCDCASVPKKHLKEWANA